MLPRMFGQVTFGRRSIGAVSAFVRAFTAMCAYVGHECTLEGRGVVAFSAAKGPLAFDDDEEEVDYEDETRH